jgi:hypothetical protein
MGNWNFKVNRWGALVILVIVLIIVRIAWPEVADWALTPIVYLFELVVGAVSSGQGSP